VARSIMPAPQSNAGLDGVRVLVVDDNQTNREILLQQLQGWGMRVHCAEGGPQALTMLADAAGASQKFQLAILDMHMPVMDGLQLANRIQAQPALAGTRLMMLSSTYANADQRAREEAGIRRYLNKPIRRADLMRAVLGVMASGPVDSAPQPLVTSPGSGRLQGHVLLVEDNPINQGVAKAMLAKLGLTWQLADNGAEAVERVREADFDLVLMDCQMPVMDGFQATAAIRRLPLGRGSTLPIIALTANAMQGDDQACLDAGMNGFLAKPYSLAALHSTLSGWLESQPGRTDVSHGPQRVAATVEATPASAPAINRTVIESLRELDEPGSMDLITQLVTTFLTSADDNLEQLAAALAQGNARSLAQLAHSMKSSAANLGAETLSSCYRELEKCGRENRVDDARGVLDRARREQRRAVTQLRELLKEPA